MRNVLFDLAVTASCSDNLITFALACPFPCNSAHACFGCCLQTWRRFCLTSLRSTSFIQLAVAECFSFHQKGTRKTSLLDQTAFLVLLKVLCQVREELRKQIAVRSLVFPEFWSADSNTLINCEEAQEEDWAHPTKIAISSFCGWVWALASFGKYVCRRMSCQSRWRFWTQTPLLCFFKYTLRRTASGRQGRRSFRTLSVISLLISQAFRWGTEHIWGQKQRHVFNIILELCPLWAFVTCWCNLFLRSPSFTSSASWQSTPKQSSDRDSMNRLIGGHITEDCFKWGREELLIQL